LWNNMIATQTIQRSASRSTAQALTPRVKAAIRRFDQQATIEWCLADPTFDEFGVEPEDLGRRVEHYRQERNFTVDFAEWLDETRRELSEAAKAALNEPAEADLNDRERCRAQHVRRRSTVSPGTRPSPEGRCRTAIGQYLSAAAAADVAKRVELDQEASEEARRPPGRNFSASTVPRLNRVTVVTARTLDAALVVGCGRSNDVLMGCPPKASSQARSRHTDVDWTLSILPIDCIARLRYNRASRRMGA
jgi:hypothetical protein